MENFTIRLAREEDLAPLLALYAHLHGEASASGARAAALWQRILADENHRVLLGCEEGAVVSSCVLLVVPNLTHGLRPYALVENVVTHPSCRDKGYATRLLGHAKALAQAAGCYKMMLMTGSKLASTLRFYERAGYNRVDKTAFVQWLP